MMQNLSLNSTENFRFLCGNTIDVIKLFPDSSVDCIITSPPYWKMRNYGKIKSIYEIGGESSLNSYIDKIVDIFKEALRILKPSGSLWINVGDKYENKSLQGIPWRIALPLMDAGWIMRNDVVWNQMKGTQSCKDRLRDSYEHFFHFVKSKKYYYDSDAIRIRPIKQPVISKDKTISATGVSGKKYRTIIADSNNLSQNEKESALAALDKVLEEIRDGEVNDFRMTIRGAQRTWHGNDAALSGRASELKKRGFYILKIRSKGHIPSDIWNIVPEDRWRKDTHCAVFPEELLRIPILATCPANGIILDPFSGTGTTVSAAIKHCRRGIGIELYPEYIEISKKRITSIQRSLI